MPDDGRQIVTYTARDLQEMPVAEALEIWTPNLAGALPDHIPLERFKRVVITAVSMNPDLAYADRRSLFNSCSRCAHDGLYPDGKEATLVVYNTRAKRRVRGPDGQWLKQSNGKYVEKEYWAELVQYMPMIAGVRKRMRNTGQVLSADVEVVHERDEFHQQAGDDPKITHKPPALSQDRGRAIGAYAIIRLKNGEVLREVMSYAEIEHVRHAFSKAPNSPAWAKSWGEMARKTVLRRCSKAAPTGSDLDELLARDDEYDQPDEHTPMREIPPRPDPSDYITIVDEEGNEQVTVGVESEPKFEVFDFSGEAHEYPTEEAAIEALESLIAAARTLRALEGLTESNPTWAQYPSIIEAFKEQKETFKDPGNGQDRPGTGAQPLDPARSATSADAEDRYDAAFLRGAGQTEHPEGEAPSTPGERITTQELPAARAATPAVNRTERPRDEPKPAAHAPRDEKFWSQKKFLLPETNTAKELLYYTQQYLRQCRDQFDVNGIETDNASRFQELRENDRKEAEGMIDWRRKELPA